ncbi:MAG: DUF3667 domain-containing protein [Marinicellaceae bacterium]
MNQKSLKFIKCPSCQQQMGKAYCSYCGEKRLDAKSRSIKHIIGDYIENISSFDNKIWRSFKLLFLYPGVYDKNYHSGRRIKYLKPISLFLIINFLFALFSPITDFNVTLIDQLTLQPYSHWVNSIHLEYLLPESGLTQNIYALKYNQSVIILSRSTIIIQALLLYFFIVIINRKKDYYHGDHLIFSLNLHSWYMAWIVILMAFIKAMIWLLDLISIDMNFGFWYYKLLPVGLGIYILIALNRLYQWNWWQTLIRGILLFAAIRICHIIYRLIQYFLVASMI